MKVREDWLAEAVEIIGSVKIADEDGRVPNEFKGYIDTFAAAVVQNGLIPAVILFEHGKGHDDGGDKEKATTEKNRKKLMAAILKLLKRKIPALGPGKPATLFKTVTQHTGISPTKPGSPVRLKEVRRHITEAVITLKLALRTFEFSDKDGTPKER